ncbi:MAG: tetratricopeptide repeat protein, partial [Alphaproteobacteria bacterium]|nr:tetratricopeptide repeat protein [Alphaproteobacteria bacterium]
IRKSSHSVHVIGVGNNEKHPVTLPNGQFWGGQTPILVELNELSNLLGNQYNYATLDDSDLKSVMDNLSVDKIEKSDAVMEQYQNLGIYGVLILLPIVALLFRRGVLFLFLICLFATPSYAGFWWRKEQELYQKQMQGIADFNVGQYEQAQKQFNDIASYDIDALYNLATAQAYAGKIEEAVATYKKVLERDPNYPDAEYNLKYLKEQIPPPPEQQSAQGQNNENSSKENQEDNHENSQNEKSEQSNDNNDKNEQGKENSDSSKSDDGEQSEEENSSAIEEQESNEKSDKAKQKSAENNGDDLTEQQATATLADITEQKDEQNEQMAPAMVPAKDQKQKEWLDKIKPNAGRVLRYRLLKQYQEQK